MTNNLMIPVIKLNNILTIKGIFLEDLESPEVVYEKRPISAQEFIECVRNDSFTTYSDIPKRFTTIAEWPKMTNLRCWTCSRTFTDYPKFVPDKRETAFIDGKEAIQWIPKGNFCKWNCVIDYIDVRMPKNRQWDLKRDTCEIASMFEGRKILCILPALPITDTKPYCGNSGITERQYEENTTKMNSIYTLGSYKISHLREN